MDAFIETVRASSDVYKALAITLMGMTGVFATLLSFFIVIKVFEVLGRKRDKNT